MRPGWTETTLGDLLPLGYGKSLPLKLRKPGPIPVYGSSGVIGYHSEALTAGPTIIVGRKGNVGEPYLSNGPCWPIDTVYFHEGCGNTQLRFFLHLLRYESLRKLDRSTAVPGLSRDDYDAVRVSIPPEAEQQRIVEAIESCTSRVDEAIHSLQRVQAKLKAYRASVLKAAVEGRLAPTEASIASAEKRDYEPAEVLLASILKERRRRWEEAELARLRTAGKIPKDDKWKAKYQEPAAADRTKLPELPEGWCWASLDQLACLLRNGESMPPREDRGVRTLRISAVRPLSVDFSDVRYLPGQPDQYRNALVEVGDLLFTRYNGTPALVGVCGMVRALSEPTVHPDKLIKVRLCSGTHVPFAELALNTGQSRSHIETRIRTTAGQAGISGADLRQMPVPLPPAAEQVRIADELEQLDSIARECDGTVCVQVRRSTRLRQSVLKWAFEGKLVDQDPSDEPAAELLARIRAERAAAVPQKKARDRKRLA